MWLAARGAELLVQLSLNRGQRVFRRREKLRNKDRQAFQSLA